MRKIIVSGKTDNFPLNLLISGVSIDLCTDSPYRSSKRRFTVSLDSPRCHDGAGFPLASREAACSHASRDRVGDVGVSSRTASALTGVDSETFCGSSCHHATAGMASASTFCLLLLAVLADSGSSMRRTVSNQ